MIKTNSVDFEALGISLPSDKIGIVACQINNNLTSSEPYRCKSEAVDTQLEAVSGTLKVAKGCHHEAEKTHFTIFPEYGLPGLEAVTRIDEELQNQDWPESSIVIGGVHGLSKDEYASLIQVPGTHVCPGNLADKVKTDEWINCAVIWAKRPTGIVERWIQPKLSPAWEEQNFDDKAMFRGKSVWVFRGKFSDGTVYRFCVLICYDWIGPPTGAKNWNNIFTALEAELDASGGEEMSVSWFFVIEHNPKPSHSSFLSEVTHFFDQTIAKKIKRDRTCVMFLNSSARRAPGRSEKFGGTSIVFSGQTLFKEGSCLPTYSKGGPRYRGSDLLNGFFDNFFRERGACVHSFSVLNPASLKAGAAGKQLAIERAFVFPLYGAQDPRARGSAVPAPVKWLNDELDEVRSLGSRHSTCPLRQSLDNAHAAVVSGLRELQFSQINRAVALATIHGAAQADEWGEDESRSIAFVVNALEIFALITPVSHQEEDIGHAVAQLSGITVDIVAVLGETHEECLTHLASKLIPGASRGLIVVTKDEDGQSWSPKEGSFLRPTTGGLSEEKKITDPQSRVKHMAYSDLLRICRESQSIADFEGKLNATIA